MRFSICVSLIIFASIVGVGALALLPRAIERSLLAGDISRRSMSSILESGSVEGRASNSVTVEASSPVENAPEQPSAEIEHVATTSEEAVQRNDMTMRDQATPVQSPGSEGKHVEMPAIKTKARLPAPKKTVRRDLGPHTNESLNFVRRFGDIPVSAYAPDGTRRSIVIQPTSMQDRYYYSVPR